ncbi:hypothetical protein Q9L58_008499 [Maublancomyces gigas]|uniref:Uncharacterized protein n=1 Tax=Discina gigas TaxID=1032678 RepID=A0ABR3G9H9_9PEZI
MPLTRSSSIAPDLDALELTLVRSIENIRKTLPQNRRQSQDLSTIAFSLGQNADTIALHTTEKNRGFVASEGFRIGEAQYDDDPMASVERNSSFKWNLYIKICATLQELDKDAIKISQVTEVWLGGNLEELVKPCHKTEPVIWYLDQTPRDLEELVSWTFPITSWVIRQWVTGPEFRTAKDRKWAQWETAP